ncbi:MAG: hypothetical protein CL832_10880 [Crocinitomicaceae bacterium]|nr:hypothetical protein [Crocinitomicaceae bacterium]|tara:strand:- start:494 stop:1093 length:600 start_codon:yes stop_codon:yes gene_type:complete
MSTLHVENLKGLSSGSNANKVIIPTGQTLEVTDNIRYDDMPAGSVIQFVHTAKVGNKGYTGESAYGSTSYTDVAGASINITPKFANSKIYITTTNHIYSTELSTNAWRGANIRIVQTISGGSATDILDDESGYGEAMYVENNTDRWMTYSTRQVIDSPNTTSQINYKVQVANKAGSNNIYMNRNSYGSGGYLIAMEIKA